MSNMTVSYVFEGRTGTEEGDYRDIAHALARLAYPQADSVTVEQQARQLREQLADLEVGATRDLPIGVGFLVEDWHIQVTRSA